MKQYFILIFLSFSLLQLVFAQELFHQQPYDHIWYLGRGNLMLDFNQESLEYHTINIPIDFDNTNSSVCDEYGNMKIYSNGMGVLSEDVFLQSGFRINPDPIMDSWVESGNRLPQGVLILPSPSSRDTFYIFYTGIFYFLNENNQQDGASKHLYYSVADFSDISSPGKLTIKDSIIINDTLDIGKIVACKHGNGRDWWITVPRLNANQFHRLLLSNEGIENHGIIESGENMIKGFGQANFSPSGKVYTNYSIPDIGTSYLSVYNFNRCNGEFSSLFTEISEVTNYLGGIATSENSRFLYLSAQYKMYQYDLEAEDIIASKTLIGEYDGFYNGDNPNFNWTTFALSQLAPDGRIYIATSVSAPQMHLVHEPNKRGLASRFEQRAIEFPVWNTRTIPNFPYYGLGPWDGSPCDTLNIDNPTPEAAFEYTQDTLGQQIEFFDASHYAYEWEWSFGDGSAVNTEQHPIHTYEASGAYDICLTVSNVTGTDMYCETIYIGVNSTQEVFVPGVSVEVAPNPFREWFRFEVGGLQTSNLEEGQLRVYNLAGQLVHQCEVNQFQTSVDGRKWPKGLYFYEVWGGNIKIATGKLVKQ